MVPLMVILTFVVFILIDVTTRLVIKRLEQKKIQKEREEALDIGLKLDYAEEAPSLKRVRVDDPKAKILAVDDEAIILDSFRKILVLAGYSVDTVETGREALGLIRKNDYDFVFTDLKMPEMDGLDVTKAVKHLRPDIDVIMITGFATIESAVSAMKFGAMDYVQKPFTVDELVDFVNKSQIRRQDRIDKQIRPSVRLVTPSVGLSGSKHEFNVPAGIFVSLDHTWVAMYSNGMLLVGIDDFTQKTLGEIAALELPEVGRHVNKGEALFSISRNAHKITFPAPASGTVTSVNEHAADDPSLINKNPFDSGWICGIEPDSLPTDLQELKIGADAVTWYKEQIDAFLAAAKDLGKEDQEKDDLDLKWEAYALLVKAK